MAIDVFKDVLVPVVGGLGVFMLGLEFMSNGIQSLAVNKMRALLAKIAGTPVKGLMAGTFITGILQSSTAMTVMVVGLVNAGVVGLRPAISVIMGANIGTTLGNGLIALPLGPLGLFLAGVFALVYVFSKTDKMKNIALACMGFALIFYGLNLMTGGLRPLRGMPEVMSVISGLKANDLVGLVSCILIAALITALIHSSSATIGIVMGLGSAGVLDWQTAVAFSLGADLGTTITSWMASLNLSKNAKRTAYAHISFNIIGVLVMIPLFFPSMMVLTWAMGWFGGDPAVPVMVNGKETFPLVPVAVGLYSTAFNIFNTALMFPFIGVFERVLSKIGHTSAEDKEDYSQPRFLDPRAGTDMVTGVPAVQKEMVRYVGATAQFLAIARDEPNAPDDSQEHNASIDVLNREIRKYTAAMFKPGMSHAQADLLASLIEEEDFTASLGETLYQTARRIERQPFSATARGLINETLDQLSEAMQTVTAESLPAHRATHSESRAGFLTAMRAKCLRLGADELSWEERGAILALLGSAERAFFLIDRIDAERRSVPRVVPAPAEAPGASGPSFDGGLAPGRERALKRLPGVDPTRRRVMRLGAMSLIAAAASSPQQLRAQDAMTTSGMKGAGSTFAQPVIARWSRLYRERQAGDVGISKGFFGSTASGLDDPLPSSVLDYEPVGSLAGMLRLKERAVDFAASDVPLRSDELTRLALAQFPIVIGGIVVAVNVEGLAPGQLRLNGPVLADIYLGRITQWSDAAIAALNPGAKLPAAKIQVVRRSDGSGTTFNFTDYLAKVSPAWKNSIGSDLTVAWPLGQGARGNSGVARAVQQTPHSIGYVEYSVAVQARLNMVSLQNQAGQFVAPSPPAFQAAAAQADWLSSPDFDLLLTDKPGAASYPIVATVYALLPRRASTGRNEAVIDFFRWSLESGAREAAALGYVPLPAPVVDQIRGYWSRLAAAARQ